MLSEAVCPCSHGRLSSTLLFPAFIGSDHFCDSGIPGLFHEPQYDVFQGANPLWDGAGCGPVSSCCSFNNPPWFHKQLPQPTADDIEMRVCINEGQYNEDIPISVVEIILYVQ